MAPDVAMTPPLTLDSRVSASPDLLASDLAGEMVLLNLADGVYYGLDAVGAHLWHLLESPHSVRALVDDVTTHFDVERTQCEGDVLAFLGDLSAHGLVLVDAPGEA